MNTFETLAFEKLQESGFSQLPLDDVLQRHSTIISGDGPFRYHAAREVSDDTHTVIMDINPYGVPADNPSTMVRRAAMTEVLGKGYALFGVEVSSPQNLPLEKKQRDAVQNSNFAPFAYRTLRAMQHMQQRYGSYMASSNLVLYGYSMGADVVAETARLMTDNVHAGIAAVTGIGVFDPARTGRRTSRTMARDFASSGPDLYEEIICSGLVSLNQARGMKCTNSLGNRRRLMLREGRQIAVANLLHPRENLALLKGFGSDQTTRNLAAIGRSGLLRSVVGRMGESTVCLPAMKESLQREHTVRSMDPDTQTLGIHADDRRTLLFEYPGYTHAAADNIRKSAGFMLQTVWRNQSC